MADTPHLPDEYDKKARKDVLEFQNRKKSALRKVVEVATTPLSKTTELIIEKTPIGELTEGVVSLINDGASVTVRQDAILSRFRNLGHDVSKPEDIHKLKLRDIDDALGFLQTKYVGVLGVEGAALGSAGTFGPWWVAGAITGDLITTIGLALRAVGEYGAYYGFPITTQLEREYALGVLHAAALPGGQEKRAAFAQLAAVAKNAGQKKAWDQLGRYQSVKTMQQLAERLSTRLTKAKLATFVPLAGGAVGFVFNSTYGRKVTDTAFHSYRGRFLQERYGEDFIRDHVAG